MDIQQGSVGHSVSEQDNSFEEVRKNMAGDSALRSWWARHGVLVITLVYLLSYAAVTVATSTDGDLGLEEVAEDLADETAGIGYHVIRIGIVLGGCACLLGMAMIQQVAVRILLGVFLIAGGVAYVTGKLGSGTLL